MATKGTLGDFRTAFEAQDWARAVEVGKVLTERLDVDAWMDPKDHATLHRDLGVAYAHMGQADIYTDWSDPLCGFEKTHSEDHFRAAKKIAEQHGLDGIAASASALIYGSPDPAVQYVQFADMMPVNMAVHDSDF
jgi:hypothetical protein